MFSDISFVTMQNNQQDLSIYSISPHFCRPPPRDGGRLPSFIKISDSVFPLDGGDDQENDQQNNEEKMKMLKMITMIRIKMMKWLS